MTRVRVNNVGRIVIAVAVLAIVGLTTGADADSTLLLDPDPSFGTDGVMTVPTGGSPATRTVSEVAVTPSGAVWALVTVGVSDLRLDRYGSDGSFVGSLDVTPMISGEFDLGRSLTTDGESAYLAIERPLSDGTPNGRVVRVMPDLTLDPSFGGDGQVMTQTNELGVPLDPDCITYCGSLQPTLQPGPDGSVYSLIYTNHDLVTNVEDVALVKIHRDGSLDTTFGVDGLVPLDPMMGDRAGYAEKTKLAVDTQGRILVVGPEGSFRFLPNGSLDPSFGTAGIAAFPQQTRPGCFLPGGCQVAVESDGSFVVLSWDTAAHTGLDYSPTLYEVSSTGTVSRHDICTLSTAAPASARCSIGFPVGLLMTPATLGGPGNRLNIVTSSGELLTLPLPLPHPASGFLKSMAVMSRINLSTQWSYSIPVALSTGRTFIAGMQLNNASQETVLTRVSLSTLDALIGLPIDPDLDVTPPLIVVAPMNTYPNPFEPVYLRGDAIPMILGCRDQSDGQQALTGITVCQASVVSGHQAVDDGSGSVVIQAPGLPLSGPGMAYASGVLPTGVVGSFTLFGRATDGAGNSSVFRHEFDVAEGVAFNLGAGESVRSGSNGPSDPLDTGIVLPAGGKGRILEVPVSGAGPAGYELFGWQVTVEHPVQSAGDPAVVDVKMPASLLAGTAVSQIRVFRDGVLVPNCSAAALPGASPDPCVKSRQSVPGGGADVFVLSSTGGVWTFGKVTAATPGAPSDVVVSPGAKKATVSWTAPADDGGAPVSKSVITATPLANSIDPATGELAVVRTASVNSDATSGSVSLSTGVTYDITVKSRNGVVSSYGPSSTPVQVTPFALQGPPSDVTATGGVRSVTLSWTPPVSDAPITGYTITVTPTGGGTPVTKTASATATTYKVTGLTDATDYTLTIATKTAVGVSAPAPAVTATTPARPAPTDLTATPAASSAALSWTAPPDDGYPVSKYVVKLTATRPDTTTHTVSKTVTGLLGLPAATTVTVTGLEPGLTYTPTVTATNAVGTGPTITGTDVTPSLGISINDASRTEGTGTGTTNATITVTLSSKATTDVTFNVSTTDGTATAPEDYTALTAAPYTIPAGTTSRKIVIKITRDATPEPDETLQLTLTDITGATPTRTTATLTILNDD